MSKASKDYEVGYGRPPVQSRFQPGQSGNSKGRPKGSHNFQTLLADELLSRVPVTINGKTVRLTKAELAIRQQVDKAAKGDGRALTIVLKMMGEGSNTAAVQDSDEGSAPVQTELTREQFSEILASVARDHYPDGAS
jgi:hypothetical protein